MVDAQGVPLSTHCRQSHRMEVSSRGRVMDISTHSATLISIVIGLGLAEMFGNLYRLIRNRGRVSWDVLPLAWMATLFFLILNYWWALFLRLNRSEKANTVAEFGLILTSPILLFLATAIVLPNFAADDDWDMRRDYEAQRKVIALTFALYQVSTFTTALVIGTMAWNFLSIVRVVIFALLVSMLVTNRRRWDWVVVLAIMIALLIRLSTQVVR